MKSTSFVSIMSADGHRRLAKRLRLNAGRPGNPSVGEAEQMAQEHEAMARVHEGRRQRAAAGLAESGLPS